MQTQHPLPQNDKAQPLISFIITYYNEPIDMLKKCIDSILMLTLNREEREIIVIDDGSDVSPLNLLTDIADQMIYIRQPNQGLSQARNTGIAMANGQYLQFVDADDFLISSNYDKCLDFIRFFSTLLPKKCQVHNLPTTRCFPVQNICTTTTCGHRHADIFSRRIYW